MVRRPCRQPSTVHHPQSCPQSCPQSVFHRPCIRTIRILPAQCRSCMATSGSPFSDVRSRVVYSRSRAVSSTALPWQYRRRALYLDGRVRDPLHSGSRIFLMLFFFEMNAGARSSHKASPHVYTCVVTCASDEYAIGACLHVRKLWLQSVTYTHAHARMHMYMRMHAAYAQHTQTHVYRYVHMLTCT